MIKFVKLPKKSNNPNYGRTVYGRLILQEYRQTITEFEKSGNKKFAAKLLKERFKTFCKEIKEDFRMRYHSPRHNVLLNKDIVSCENQLHNLIALQ